MQDPVRIFYERALKFQDEAHSILGRVDGAHSRVVSLERTRREAENLSLYQKKLFEEAIRCIEHGCFRAAHVVGWAAFMDYLERKLASDDLRKVKRARPKWSRFRNIEELRDNIAEHQFIDVARDIGIILKSECKTLHGLLAKRNECAHPSNYDPDMNATIGYISELICRIRSLEERMTS